MKQLSFLFLSIQSAVSVLVLVLVPSPEGVSSKEQGLRRTNGGGWGVGMKV